MKAVIVAGGTPPSYELLKGELKENTLIICADSGGDCLYKYGILPDYLLGDFDSISEEALNYLKGKGVSIDSFRRDKDYTDTQLALNKAIDLGCEEIVLLGCSGNRIDHMLGNLGLLKEALSKGVKAYLKDDISHVQLTKEPIEIKGAPGEVFSLQAYCGCVEEVTIIGAKFPLNKYDLYLGDPLTISNEFLKDKVRVEFKSGYLLVIKNSI